MLEISGAVAVITGATGGLGENFARYWVKNGGKLVLADRSLEDFQRVEKDIKTMGGEIAVTVCDVTNEEDNHKLATLAIERFGAINLVLPFAGITKDGMMLSIDKNTGKVTGKMSLSQFQSVADVNLTGVFLTVRECAEQMINLGNKGLICLISSTGSLGTAGQINYSPTKAGVSVMPKVITAEFFRRNVADRVRCVAVAPGYSDTTLVTRIDQKILEKILQQVPIQRLIEPQEISSLICELYRNEACAGEVFYISGGLRLGSRG